MKRETHDRAVKNERDMRGRERERVTERERAVNREVDTFAKKRADTHKPAFRVAKTVVACASLAKQAEQHQSCSAKITGTAAASETQAQAAQGDCIASFGSGVRLAFTRRPHTLLARQSSSEGTACKWDEFSILGAELWTTPSSSAPNVGRSTGSVRTRYATTAAESQEAEHHSCAN